MDADQAQEHVPPPVPLKTYKWEDVRREKMAGVYPWTYITKGPFDEKQFEHNRDHEYEPISPPASQQASPPLLKVTDQEGQEKTNEPELEFKPETEIDPEKIDFAPIIDRSKHEYLRIPLDRDLIIPIDKAEIESLRYDDEEETDLNLNHMTPQDVQAHTEGRVLSTSPTTTTSRTDGEFNTSHLESSGLQEVPLKREGTKGLNTKGFQQRIQSQAGKLRTRLRNISKPKINLPERPKLNLPERPKFNIPERPKFNIKRPDLKIPNFSFGKTKSSSIKRPLRDKTQISNQSTLGSKKNIFDSINFRTYPRIFNKKRKTEQGRRSLTPPARMETESSPPSSPASRTGPTRWKQLFKDIKFADGDNLSNLKKPSFDDDVEDDTAPFRDSDFNAVVSVNDNKRQAKVGSSTSIPGSDKEQQSSGSSSEKHRAGVIEEIDSDEFFLREKGLSREDVDVSRYLSLEIRDAFRSPKNDLVSMDRELYDEDDGEGYEYETKNLPISVPIRLSMEEIRKHSLEQLRMTPDRDSQSKLKDKEFKKPIRPERTRSLKKHSRSHSDEQNSDLENQFNTYPPDRPTRMRKQSSQSKHSITQGVYDEPIKDSCVEVVINEKRQPSMTNLTKPNRMRKQSSQSKHSITSERADDLKKENNELGYIVTRQGSIPSLPIKDISKELFPTRYIDESSEALSEPWRDEAVPPIPPKRRRSTIDSSLENESLSAHYKEFWLDEDRHENIILADDATHERRLHHNRLVHTGYYDTPPQAPIRKSRSQGTSLGDEDRTSRGADSLISETRTHLTEDMPDDTKPELNTFSPDNFAYANINKAKRDITSSAALKKPNCTPPPSRKSKTAAQLTALKNQSINFFFTYPRRAIKKSLQKQSPTPVRPSRNYTSIGPSRPPRHNRVFREPVYEGEFIPLKDENNVSTKQGESKIEEIDCEIVDSILLETTTYDNAAEKSDQEGLKSEETRDLQSGDVIEKMKSRPLPPPPRPPRKTKDDSTDTADEGDNGDLIVSDDNQDGELAPDAYVNENIVVERLNILVATPQPDHEKKVDFGNHSILVDVLSDGNKKCSKPIDYLRKQEWLYEEKQVPDIELTSIHTVDKLPIKSERRKKSLTTPNKIQLPIHPVEITASTQTDALPDGCNVEEEEQTLDDYSKSEVTLAKESHPRREEIIEVEKKVETIVEHKVVVIPTPETEILKAKKLHVEELDVEKLSVNELQAKTITVSDIDGVSMQVTELSSKSGHLVISGFDLPSSFLEAITPPPPPPPVIQIQSSTQTPPQTNDSQTNTTPQEDVRYDVHSTTVQSQTSQSPIPTPANTPHKQPSPPPSIIIQSPQGQSSSVYIPTSPPPRSSIRPTSHGPETEEEFRILPRRRRQHSQRHQTRYSSDDDEVEPISYPIVRRSHHHESTATNLIKQLLTIWQNSVTRGVNSFVDSVNSVFPQGEKRKDAQTAACIVLVLIAGILLGFGSERTVHHHHWDFLPPHP